MELDGQVAIVTGAGRGIGRATALELGRMGAAIVVAELDPRTAERTAGEVRPWGAPRWSSPPTSPRARPSRPWPIARSPSSAGSTCS